jgi:hypothetical protein
MADATSAPGWKPWNGAVDGPCEHIPSLRLSVYPDSTDILRRFFPTTSQMWRNSSFPSDVASTCMATPAVPSTSGYISSAIPSRDTRSIHEENRFHPSSQDLGMRAKPRESSPHLASGSRLVVIPIGRTPTDRFLSENLARSHEPR